MTVAKSALSILVVVVTAFFFSTGTASAQATTSDVYPLTFYGPDDVYTFRVEKAGEKAGDLTVDTRDCCIVGDQWRVDLYVERPANGGNDRTGIGNGSTTTFSGGAWSHPFIQGEVEVSYEEGADIFPAGMHVRFRYSEFSGMVIQGPYYSPGIAAATVKSLSSEKTPSNVPE